MNKLITGKREKEKRTVEKMIRLYCQHHLRQEELQEEYQQLVDYCARRLDHCSWGDAKPACQDCPHHCYAPRQREQIRQVMRWVGPRIVVYGPMEYLRHLLGRD